MRTENEGRSRVGTGVKRAYGFQVSKMMEKEGMDSVDGDMELRWRPWMENEKQVEHRNPDVMDSWVGGPRLKKKSGASKKRTHLIHIVSFWPMIRREIDKSNAETTADCNEPGIAEIPTIG